MATALRLHLLQRFLLRLDLHHAPHLAKSLVKEPHLRRLLVPRLQARQAVRPVQALLHRQVHDLAPSQPVLEFRQVSNQAQVQAYRPHNLQMTVQVLLHRDLQANNPVETVKGRQPPTNLHSRQVETQVENQVARQVFHWNRQCRTSRVSRPLCPCSPLHQVSRRYPLHCHCNPPRPLSRLYRRNHRANQRSFDRLRQFQCVVNKNAPIDILQTSM